ncbi:MAG: nucleoside-diphosphate kinase [Fimbriimonadales bacterium]
MSNVERTLVLVKPDGVSRGLSGEVIRRFESRGLKLIAMKLVKAPQALVEEHYEEHKGKSFFGDLVTYLTSGPVVAMVLEGQSAVKASRLMMGATNAAEAEPGTIRGDFALSIEKNIVHGSADPEAAAREIAVWFSNQEMV